MSFLSFEHPFTLLLLIPLLYCYYKCKDKLESKPFVNLHFFRNIKSIRHFRKWIEIAILLLLVLALASPIFVDKASPLNRNGKDIVLAIDGSGSMNSSGFDTEDEVSNGERLSRFELTKKIASEFIQKRVEDNVGVVLFGDFAFIASPITYEKDIVVEMLGYLSHGMAGQNTAIGEGVEMGVRSLKHSKAKSKVIILLTDGEHNSGRISPRDAVALAKKNEIKIYTIGIGNRGEADAALLQEMAQSSGGEFFHATSAKELKKVYKEIDELESSAIKSKEYLKFDLYYFVPLSLALALLLFLLYKERG